MLPVSCCGERYRLSGKTNYWRTSSGYHSLNSPHFLYSPSQIHLPGCLPTSLRDKRNITNKAPSFTFYQRILKPYSQFIASSSIYLFNHGVLQSTISFHDRCLAIELLKQKGNHTPLPSIPPLYPLTSPPTNRSITHAPPATPQTSPTSHCHRDLTALPTSRSSQPTPPPEPPSPLPPSPSKPSKSPPPPRSSRASTSTSQTTSPPKSPSVCTRPSTTKSPS